ncbi:MAG: M23 family metallopeptidase [Roseofilum sp. SBFL]|uniref:M23 family metallopeptidase n=1 Tax=unclassified Roseofilum TaxID=2620099 RepID=UPI001B29F1FA|nr:MULTISPECIES: M23 family metallopeptidase [unclassified Roseofilum]MBP0015598.1 M23 family metallopeptidase [Roseofilum sp. SID3]MBP0022695.1 M23 family metallopeptidase [Roseofilum sp. SID2]MBP0039255.1 M23 family metallopeptidase [Roseofilum sp. SID1]MBP0042663.1 M23 family metallopeptidase [Roseofilum sp. SBFL]
MNIFTRYQSTLLTLISWAALSQPLQALQVRVNPQSAQLGDTISVQIQVTTPDSPTVQMGNTTYPVFPLSPNRFRALIPSSPLDNPGTWSIQVQGDGKTETVRVGMGNRTFPTQSIWLSESDAALEGTDHEFDSVDAFKSLVTPQKFWNGPFLRPSSGYVSTVFGVQRYYNGEFADNYYHRGVDYAAATGSPVIAPAAGIISLVGREVDGFEIHGNTIGLDHGQGILSIFIHLHTINVQEGQRVEAGQVIGTVGSTGASTGPHLHWGLYVNGVAVDPVPWRYEGIE